MDGRTTWDGEILSDALDVLQDLVVWELTPQRWEQAGRILERIAAALAAGDADELQDAVADLELSGPVRAQRIGTVTITGIPEPVLDRRNSLVHTLVGARTDPPAGPGGKDGGDAGQAR